MLNNKKITLHILIYFSKFQFLREMSVYSKSKNISYYLFNLTA